MVDSKEFCFLKKIVFFCFLYHTVHEEKKYPALFLPF